MGPRQSHTLAPLTKIVSNKSKFKWTKIKQDAFGEINRIVDRNTLLTYPGFNETFKIHTYASGFQLGEVFGHKGKPIPSYNRKLTDSQEMYTVTEREIISIVETLK